MHLADDFDTAFMEAEESIDRWARTNAALHELVAKVPTRGGRPGKHIIYAEIERVARGARKLTAPRKWWMLWG